MAFSIPRSLVESILLARSDDRWQLQDSLILGDVWIAFGKQPTARLDLFISLETPKLRTLLTGLVAARLTFDELLNVVVPPRRNGGFDKWTKELPSKEPEFRHEVMRRYAVNRQDVMIVL
jgi:hypothetical protein